MSECYRNKHKFSFKKKHYWGCVLKNFTENVQWGYINVHVPENFWIGVKQKETNIIEEKSNDENDVHGYFLVFYLELGDTISGFFGGKDNKDDKKPTTDETAQEVSISCLQCDSSFCLLLTFSHIYLQFSMWVSFSFSFKFILFSLNHCMIC